MMLRLFSPTNRQLRLELAKARADLAEREVLLAEGYGEIVSLHARYSRDVIALRLRLNHALDNCRCRAGQRQDRPVPPTLRAILTALTAQHRAVGTNEPQP